MPSGTHPDRRSTLLIILFVLAVIGLVVDLWDGYVPKILMSLGISVGLGAMLLHRRTGSSVWRNVGLAGVVLALAAMVYRLITYLSA